MDIYYVMDEQAQMPVYAFRGPVGWTLGSDVQWNLENNVVPVTLGSALTDRQETKRLQFFPDLTCYWLTGDAALNNPGQMNMGMLNIAQEKYIDSIHDRETFHDAATVTGTSQHGYADHHWSDGWGNSIHTDNSTIDPNIGSSVQWEQLQRVE